MSKCPFKLDNEYCTCGPKAFPVPPLFESMIVLTYNNTHTYVAFSRSYRNLGSYQYLETYWRYHCFAEALFYLMLFYLKSLFKGSFIGGIHKLTFLVGDGLLHCIL